MIDQLVAQLRHNQRRYRVNADYDLVREQFDHYHYLFQDPELQEHPDVDPIRIFVRSGAKTRVSPDPHFSMRKYLDRYPERKNGTERSPYLEWLKRGKDAGEIADPADGVEPIAFVLGLEPHQVVDEVVRIRTDVMERLRCGVLGEMFAKAVELDPLIGEAWPEAVARLKQLPLRNESVTRAAAALYQCHQDAGFRRARIAIVTDRPGLHRQGLDRRLARALEDTIAPEEIVVIYTDEGATSTQDPLSTGEPETEAVPGGVREMDPTPGEARETGPATSGVREIDLASRLTRVEPNAQEQALVSLLRSLAADAIINWDSALFYRTLSPYGRALAHSERIFLYFSYDEQRPLGIRDGSALRWGAYPAFDYVAGIITDGEYMREAISEHYQLGEPVRERILVFRTPARADLPVAAPASGTRKRRSVFWVGHFGWQSRIDLVLEIARRMPDVDFRLWHHEAPEMLHREAVGDLPDNVITEGSYRELSDLDLSRADAWLYTSAWDGVPELLLDVAMTEVPIVASRVGGVSELISESDAWPIEAWENPEAYADALRDILADTVEARRRSHALRERLIRERTQSAYAEYAVEVLLKPVGPADGTKEWVR